MCGVGRQSSVITTPPGLCGILSPRARPEAVLRVFTVSQRRRSVEYETALPYIENKRLDTWTHNKTIQKSIESYRITPEQKEYLRSLKIRGNTK